MKKKDGKLRFCIDYRNPNSMTDNNMYHLQSIHDCIDTLGEAQYDPSLEAD